jgi:undecaprenol kinase
MSMDLKETKSRWKRFIYSFKYAFGGIWTVWKGEQNFKVHLFAAVLVCVTGFVLSISPVEWSILLLLIFGILALETMNTAIEKTVDLITSDYQPLAKVAKDLAAGSVLIFSIAAIIIGAIIFVPKLIEIIIG